MGGRAAGRFARQAVGGVTRRRGAARGWRRGPAERPRSSSPAPPSRPAGCRRCWRPRARPWSGADHRHRVTRRRRRRAAGGGPRDLWDWVVVTSPNGAGGPSPRRAAEPPHLALRWAVVGRGRRMRSPRWASTPPSCPTACCWPRTGREPSPTLRPAAVGCCWRRQARPVPGRRVAGPGLGRVDRQWPTGRSRSPRLRTSCGPRRRADAIAFTSGSTVDGSRQRRRRGRVPSVVVAIGPVTAAAVAAHGLEVAAEADPHSLAGLVEATVAALS